MDTGATPSAIQPLERVRRIRPQLIAQPNWDMVIPAVVRERGAVETWRAEGRGGVVRETISLLGLAEQTRLHLRLILAVLS